MANNQADWEKRERDEEWHHDTFENVYRPERAEQLGLSGDMDNNEIKYQYLEQDGFQRLPDGRWYNPDTNVVLDEFRSNPADLVGNEQENLRYGDHTNDFLQRLVDKYKPRRMMKTVTPINRAMPVQDEYDAEGGSHRTDREPEE